ncbi:ABC transporter family substrate-binding protein [Gandjariella thermophila]|uniref:Peptide ABC transporter substrate-binding protein n=1 Tax=Gandjariella thermophila TaxID=1931992 RepID=A0A4D4J4C4_9PSEU|nr:ABC transporter family substrate-binding protein [Gandjariella thermophila]GDY29960.1 peptide ABC transporter substrate-binding protein [Gandjariella thermophila]
MAWWARRGASRLIPLLLAGIAGLTGCASTPPPPPLVNPKTTTTTPRPVDTAEVIVGVDGVTGGYNPHTLADQSATTTALSDLMLPSVFRPAADGSPRLDRTLMVSAEVTSAEPYTVTYTIRREASWSDYAPIAAEDFVYLWQQMRSQPGVVDPAGYRLISDISSRDGGKTVVVTFSKPYPGWRSLFGNLLPAHLLKDAPGGWTSALAENFPATGGPFAIKQLDRDRGEITLERNDRWWDRPAALDRIVLRKSDAPGMVAALRSGDDQVALLRADGATDALLHQLAGVVQLDTVPRGDLVQLLLRPASPRLADARVRGAVAAALDRDSLIAAGTGNGPAARLRADAHVLPPSRPGYAPTMPSGGAPAHPDPATVDRLLTEAGYTRLAGAWMRDGRPLSLVIGAPADRPQLVDLAGQVQRQLTAAGIDAKVATPSPDQLYDTSLAGAAAASGAAPDGGVDIAVVPEPVGGDPATVLASQFGCPPPTPDGAKPLPGNPAGFCDPTIQPAIDGALTGRLPLPDALAAVEPVLWQQSVAIPLFQPADELAVRSEVSGPTAGAPFTGPFGNASVWQRAKH